MNNSNTEADIITALVVANNVLMEQSRVTIDDPEFQKCFQDALNKYRDLALQYVRNGVPDHIIQDIGAPCKIITSVADD